MITDGRKTPFVSRVTARGFEVEMEPLVHPNTQGVDIQIIYTISDAIHRVNEAYKRGVLVTITPRVEQKEDNVPDEGLYHKYDVTNHQTGEDVRGCFVLRPDRDPDALAALKVYADRVEAKNPTLAGDLRHMIQRLESAS